MSVKVFPKLVFETLSGTASQRSAVSSVSRCLLSDDEAIQALLEKAVGLTLRVKGLSQRNLRMRKVEETG